MYVPSFVSEICSLTRQFQPDGMVLLGGPEPVVDAVMKARLKNIELSWAARLHGYNILTMKHCKKYMKEYNRRVKMEAKWAKVVAQGAAAAAAAVEGSSEEEYESEPESEPESEDEVDEEEVLLEDFMVEEEAVLAAMTEEEAALELLEVTPPTEQELVALRDSSAAFPAL
jgi:hypothetical protein